MSRKVFMAVLNNGSIRSELPYILRTLDKTPNIDLEVKPLYGSWEVPISSNRNIIVREFLETENEFLLMLDSDVIPLRNPLDFVFSKERLDVVSYPTLVRAKGLELAWNCYIKVEGGYVSVDFSDVDYKADLLKVDAVGTGCILIHRSVLETVKKPFSLKEDQYGRAIRGTDFHFSEKAVKAGFKLWAPPKYMCEHFKEVGLLDIQGYYITNGRNKIARNYELPWTPFAITLKDWHFIKQIILEEKIKVALEFGSGFSSLLMSELCKVDSFETDNKWRNKVNSCRNGNDLYVYNWNKINFITKDRYYDLAFIDGPVGECNGGPGREESFKNAILKSDRIIVHDAGRAEEMKLQDKYLVDFDLKDQNGWHQQRCNYWARRGNKR